MKSITAGLILVFLVHTPSAAAKTDTETVTEITAAVLEQLRVDRERLSTDPDYVQQVVMRLIIPQFDFNTMSQLVLGNYWQELDRVQQACFSSGFTDMLTERYAYILLSYDNHEITYGPSKSIGNQGYRVVRQTISREGMDPLPVEYAMEQLGEEWKVVDLVVDGVSLVRNYRGMFQSKIHLQGVEFFLSEFPGCMPEPSQE